MRKLLIAAVVIQRLWFMAQYPICAEDAYITFHAAIDPSWMKAATSPIYAMFLGATPDPPFTARILALLADVGALWAVLSIATLEGGILFCLFWVTPFMTGSALSGLETHLAACALVMALAWPRTAVLACLRPDAIAMAFVASGRRWVPVACGAAVFIGSAMLLAGGPPQTIGSKLATYGVHWFKGWYWLTSEGLEWLEVPLILGGIWAAWRTRRWLYLASALAPICLHWALGTPNFWWYAVAPAAMLAALTCQHLGRKGMMVGIAAILVFWTPQWERFSERMRQEKTLWEAGGQLATMASGGAVFLEPAGIIPWINRDLAVVDEIGLVEPWVAKRREQGDGWMADALKRYQPDWIVVRTKFLRNPTEQFTGRNKPFRSFQELYSVLDTLPGYWIMAIATVDGQHVRYQSCDMAILQRKDMVEVPKDWKPPMIRVEPPLSANSP